MKHGMFKNIMTTLTDMVAHSTFFYFPIFYVFKGFVYQRNVSLDIIKQQLHQYFAVNFNEDVSALFKLWTPAIFLMFAAVPIQHRISWISSVGIVWAIILSLKRGDAREDKVCMNDAVQIQY